MSRLRLRLAALALLVTALAGACDHKTPTEPTPDCTAGVVPSTLSFEAAGGSTVVVLSIAPGCAWTAQSDASWATMGTSAGSGPASIAVTAAANGETSARSGTLTVAGKAVSVTQKGKTPTPPPNCTYVLAPEQATYSRGGGTGTVTVTTPAGCAWAAASSASWLVLGAGNSGSGNGSFSYEVSANAGTSSRTGTITVADRTVTVTQDGNLDACTYSVTPVEFTPCNASTELVATLTTQTACPWTSVPNVNWISLLSGTSGTGSSLIRFSVTSNYDATRSGIVMVRWPTVTAGQNLHVAQAGCRYGVSQNSFAVAVTGGAFRFDVVQESDPNTCGGPLQDKCVWSAVSDVSWIVVTTPMPRTGDNPVNFTVQANATGAARNGTIVVRDQVVRISQAGS
jgi:hypothetical protein